jgi:hypothetical protein
MFELGCSYRKEIYPLSQRLENSLQTADDQFFSFCSEDRLAMIHHAFVSEKEAIDQSEKQLDIEYLDRKNKIESSYRNSPCPTFF